MRIMNKFSVQHVFDCHLCNTKKTTFEVLAENDESRTEQVKTKSIYVSYFLSRQICKCNSCNRIFFQVVRSPKKTHFLMSGQYPHSQLVDGEDTSIILFQYPFAESGLPEYIDKLIRKYYIEAVACLSVEAHDAASVMFRKCVYRL